MPMSNRLEIDLLELLLENNVSPGSLFEDLGLGTDIAPTGTDGFVYISLHEDAPGDTGDQLTNETSYGSGGASYARQPVPRDDPSWDVSGSIYSNAQVISFDPSDGSTVTITHFGMGTDLTTGGNLMFWGPLGISNSLPCMSNVTAEDIYVADHGFTTDDQLVFITTVGDALPTGLTEGTVYYVMSTGNTAHTFNVSTAPGDSGPVNITAAGAGRVQEIVQKQIDAGDSLEFGAGALSIELD